MLKSTLLSIVALASLVSATSQQSDVRITEPSYANAWKAGNNYTVSWEALPGKKIPESSNGFVRLYLPGFQNETDAFTKANDFTFPLSQKSVKVYVPKVHYSGQDHFLQLYSVQDKSTPIAFFKGFFLFN
ncbi:hypothetical protein BDF14DRAFT_1841530 [Spinellus fusiger]|nr:hypothetical protein BDF14DRAFT_1841530 [Spinellus fusiger]